MSELSDLIDNLANRYRPHAVSPVTARRKPTDSRPPAGAGEAFPKDDNTNASRAHGARYGTYFRPNAAYFAGNAVPAMARATVPGVKPSSHRKGQRMLDGTVSYERAYAEGETDARRAWVTARENIARDAGDVLTRDQHYPKYLTERGNLGPHARY